MSAPIKVGDFVVVKGGPAYVKGARNARGRVVEVNAYAGPNAEVMVKVTSGGIWGFKAGDLRVLAKADE